MNRFWWDQILDQQGWVLIIPLTEAPRGQGLSRLSK